MGNDEKKLAGCPGDYCSIRTRCARWTRVCSGGRFEESPVEPGGKTCRHFIADPSKVGARLARFSAPRERYKSVNSGGKDERERARRKAIALQRKARGR